LFVFFWLVYLFISVIALFISFLHLIYTFQQQKYKHLKSITVFTDWKILHYLVIF